MRFNIEAIMSQSNNIFENRNSDITEMNINSKNTLGNYVPVQITIYKKTSMKDLKNDNNLSFEKGSGIKIIKRSYSQKQKKCKEVFDSIFKFTINNYNVVLTKPLLSHRKKNLTIDLDKYKHIFEDPQFTICSSYRRKSPFDTRRRSKTFLSN